jgi:hypothetical protein
MEFVIEEKKNQNGQLANSVMRHTLHALLEWFSVWFE